MASQTFSTPPISRPLGVRAFTLVEVLIGASLTSFILLGVLTAFLMMGRVSANIQNYTDIEARGRAALETMSREIRAAFNITTYSTTGVTLSIPDASASRTTLAYNVTYAYNSGTGSITRTGPPVDNPAGTSATTTLITGVQPITGSDVFNYYRYVNSSTLGLGYVDGFQTNTVTGTAPTSAIQQIEVKFLVRRASATVTAATNKVLSARFIIRNK